MTPFPKMPPFSKQIFADRLKAGVGNYAVFDQFAIWAKRVDGLRDNVEQVRVGVFGKDGIKEDLDVLRGSTDRRLDVVEADVAALKAVRPPFGRSGSG